MSGGAAVSIQLGRLSPGELTCIHWALLCSADHRAWSACLLECSRPCGPDSVCGTLCSCSQRYLKGLQRAPLQPFFRCGSLCSRCVPLMCWLDACWCCVHCGTVCCHWCVCQGRTVCCRGGGDECSARCGFAVPLLRGPVLAEGSPRGAVFGFVACSLGLAGCTAAAGVWETEMQT